MKKLLLILCILLGQVTYSQTKKNAFNHGEWLKYRIHYGFINAGYATIDVKDTVHHNRPAFHITGNGWTVGVTKFFFKVDDNYETSFYKDDLLPYHFKRRVDEGGYIISRDIYFDQYQKKEAKIIDHKHKKEDFLKITQVQDMISSLFYLRSFDYDTAKIGDEKEFKMFFDSESYDFKMRFLGKETIETKFGKVPCLKFRPIVKSGRVFKEKESVTVWVTDDKNKLPIRIQATLAVGSLKADLEAFKGLSYPFNVVFDD